MRLSIFSGAVLATLAVVVGAACSSTDTAAPRRTDAGAETQAVDAGGAGDFGTFGSDTTDASASGKPVGNGKPELCDGIDNDENGAVDDLDVAGDGICDCLRIATLGAPGRTGTGNVFSTWLNSRSNSGATAIHEEVLTKELLNQFQVIVAQDLSTMTRTYAPAEVAALEAWVKAGGGFMTLIGYAGPSERTNVNTLLAPYGMSYLETQVLKKNGGTTVAVTRWTPHPLTDNITKVGVDNGYPVSGGTVLANEGGFDMLGAKEVNLGHVVVWGDEWITFDSEWSGHPEYQVERFWLNSIKWLTAARSCQVKLPPVVR